ncbi:polysaccharide deacetylase family protein [Kibdelosporangium philippinense]|uniref:Polysaccharide deacetylase family protein n=1 Tax=Kibdelosporangium philippinense TaxID=211113 RepID=A0ABS8Z680_9PSEU|nr:polysaccharide deacetylase family protein [Kibdelosporangium philippinense]MCE7002141.1 polysaccharide deacetylase family protein [Kibdelosporangium philippinense]
MTIRRPVRRLSAIFLALSITFTGMADAAPSAPGTTATPENHRPRPVRVSGGWQWPVLPAPPPATRPDPKSTTTSAAATDSPPHARTYPSAPGADPSRRTLVLYDTGGMYGWLGESYAVMAGNLVSHSSSWTMHPVRSYRAGEMSGYTSVIYIGSTSDEPLPNAFLDDVLAGGTPVAWMFDSIWRLAERDANFAARFGWRPGRVDTTEVTTVRYRDVDFTRDRAAIPAGIVRADIDDEDKVRTVAEAVRSDGNSFPWIVRSKHLTYFGEVPFTYTGPDDRYLAAADVLSRHADPVAPDRKRALVRIEDVGPDDDPAQLRKIASYLADRRVPFSVAVYPRYRDPHGVYHDGKPTDRSLADAPNVVAALRYMQDKGGTLIMHGYTHQYGNTANPHNGASADDYEFYRVRINDEGELVYVGPVPEDSRSWATGRIRAAEREFRAVGLEVPEIFEFPHYAGSAIDYTVVNDRFAARYDNGLYAAGWCRNGDCGSGIPDYSRIYGQSFPFLVRDIYGSVVIPESLGYVDLTESDDHRNGLPAQILATARRVAVVRDGVASFFYHPYLGTSRLGEVVDGIEEMGFTFTSPADLDCCR